eukprot:scaffold103562_cov64-Phaeocystis_antarctica.AAC.2
MAMLGSSTLHSQQKTIPASSPLSDESNIGSVSVRLERTAAGSAAGSAVGSAVWASCRHGRGLGHRLDLRVFANATRAQHRTTRKLVPFLYSGVTTRGR